MSVKTDIDFRISGPCLSLLLRDCECSVSDQVGFLIGEKTTIRTQTTSDAEMEEEKIQTTISINGTLAVGLPFLFCDPLGRVYESSLKSILGNLEKDVVGWYSFRRNTSHSPSLRETLLHHELTRALSNSPYHSSNPSHPLVLCKVTATEADCSATHSLKLTFLVFSHRSFQPVSVAETNLGETEDNVYRESSNIGPAFRSVKQVINSLNGVQNPKQAMMTFHQEVNKQVEALESRVSNLQAEVDMQIRASSATSSSCDKQVLENTPIAIQDNTIVETESEVRRSNRDRWLPNYLSNYITRE